MYSVHLCLVYFKKHQHGTGVVQCHLHSLGLMQTTLVKSLL